MENGLSVVADEVDFLGGDLKLLASGQSGLGVDLPEAGVQLAQFSGRQGMLFGYAKDFLADFWREGLLRVIDEPDFQTGRGARDSNERGVNTVGRSAGHHAEDEFCGRGHKWLKKFLTQRRTGNREERKGSSQRVNALAETPSAAARVKTPFAPAS